jgi:dienelactone hydrolase
MTVTAHVCVPDGLPAPAPAVLFSSGHGAKEGEALAATQAFCINMARLGFIVLSADPIGRGERESKSGHRHPEALLVGSSEPGIVEYETRCALEYLRSRKDVDAARIGLTGVDEGGFSAWAAAALDGRIAAVVPVEGTFDFLDRIRQMRATDWNEVGDRGELVPGVVQYANIHEFLAAAAPGVCW